MTCVWTRWSSAAGSPECRRRWTWPIRASRWRWSRRKPASAGKMITLSKVFPTLDCCSCITTPRCRPWPIIRTSTADLLRSAVGAAKRSEGFDVAVLKKPRYVDVSKCTGCRECEYDCPITVPSPIRPEPGRLPRHPRALLHGRPAEGRAGP